MYEKFRITPNKECVHKQNLLLFGQKYILIFTLVKDGFIIMAGSALNIESIKRSLSILDLHYRLFHK